MKTGNKPCPSIRSRLTMIESVKTLDAMVCDHLLTIAKGPWTPVMVHCQPWPKKIYFFIKNK